jgi:hypothetical protein
MYKPIGYKRGGDRWPKGSLTELFYTLEERKDEE